MKNKGGIMNTFIEISPEDINFFYNKNKREKYKERNISDLMFLSRKFEPKENSNLYKIEDIDSINKLYSVFNKNVERISFEKEINFHCCDVVNVKNDFTFIENFVITKHLYALFLLYFITYNIELNKNKLIDIYNGKGDKIVYSEEELEVISFLKVYLYLSNDNFPLSRYEYSLIKTSFFKDKKEHNLIKKMSLKALPLPPLNAIEKIINNKKCRNYLLKINPNLSYFIKNIEGGFHDQLMTYLLNKEAIDEISSSNRMLCYVNNKNKTFNLRSCENVFETIFLSQIKDHRLKIENSHIIKVTLFKNYDFAKFNNLEILQNMDLYYNMVSQELEFEDGNKLSVFLFDEKKKKAKIPIYIDNEYKEIK